jgi:hypothetical protein
VCGKPFPCSTGIATFEAVKRELEHPTPPPEPPERQVEQEGPTVRWEDLDDRESRLSEVRALVGVAWRARRRRLRLWHPDEQHGRARAGSTRRATARSPKATPSRRARCASGRTARRLRHRQRTLAQKSSIGTVSLDASLRMPSSLLIGVRTGAKTRPGKPAYGAAGTSDFSNGQSKSRLRTDG